MIEQTPAHRVVGSPTPAHSSGATAAAVILHETNELPTRTYAKGDRLYDAHTDANALYVVEAGLVALELATPKPRIIGLAGPGDIVGAIAAPALACPDTDCYGAACGATSGSTYGASSYLESAVALSGEVVVRIFDDRTHGSIGADRANSLLLNAAAWRLTELTHALEDSEYPVPARVARAFLRLASRFGRQVDSTVRLTLPITHDTLAAMVGAARETTTAQVATLRQLGLVEGTRGSYRIRPTELAEYALNAAINGA